MSAIAWAVAGVICLIGESLTMTFVVVYFGIGAFAASASALLGAPVWGQMVVFAVVATALMLATRRVIVEFVEHRQPSITATTNPLIGKRGIVTIDVSNDASSGQIRIGTEFWTARSIDDDGVIAVGETVDVVEVAGVTAYVRPRHLHPAAPS
jgi:membrane protein implicated in regulation of membrane protease activity